MFTKPLHCIKYKLFLVFTAATLSVSLIQLANLLHITYCASALSVMDHLNRNTVCYDCHFLGLMLPRSMDYAYNYICYYAFGDVHVDTSTINAPSRCVRVWVVSA